MPGHKRILSVGLIIAAAKTAESFEHFEEFMLTVSPHCFLDKNSTILHRMFGENPRIRRDLWILIGTQQPQKNVVPRIIQTLCKVWLVIKNKGNEGKHEVPIDKYLELAKSSNRDYSVIMADIIKVLK